MNVVFSRSKCVPGVSRTLKMCRNCWNKTTALPECWDRVPPAAQRKIFAKKIFQRIFFPKFFQKFKKVEQNVFYLMRQGAGIAGRSLGGETRLPLFTRVTFTSIGQLIEFFLKNGATFVG